MIRDASRASKEPLTITNLYTLNEVNATRPPHPRDGTTVVRMSVRCSSFTRHDHLARGQSSTSVHKYITGGDGRGGGARSLRPLLTDNTITCTQVNVFNYPFYSLSLSLSLSLFLSISLTHTHTRARARTHTHTHTHTHAHTHIVTHIQHHHPQFIMTPKGPEFSLADHSCRKSNCKEALFHRHN